MNTYKFCGGKCPSAPWFCHLWPNIHNNNSDHNPTLQQNKKTINNRKAKKDRIRNAKHIPDECLNPNCYQCVVHNVVNHSDTQLTQAQVMVLNKVLFCTTAPKKVTN